METVVSLSFRIVKQAPSEDNDFESCYIHGEVDMRRPLCSVLFGLLALGMIDVTLFAQGSGTDRPGSGRGQNGRDGAAQPATSPAGEPAATPDLNASGGTSDTATDGAPTLDNSSGEQEGAQSGPRGSGGTPGGDTDVDLRPATDKPKFGEGDSTPLVIALDETPEQDIFLYAPVRFDINGDKRVDILPWVRPEIAFIAIDRNHNGKIDSGAELLGDAFVTSNEERAPNGFFALASLDQNHDGVVDAKDPAFGQLLLWHDRNSNGVSEPAELLPLSQSAVKSLSVRFSSLASTVGVPHIKWVGTATVQKPNQPSKILPVWDVVFPFQTMRGN